ncbi:MAG: hypothetical protein ABEI74_00960 [Candidatus Pacearchaeota archaeon]
MTYDKRILKYFEQGYQKGFTLDRLSQELLKAGFDSETVSHSINKFLQLRNVRKKLGFKSLSLLQIWLIIIGVLLGISGILVWIYIL